MTSKRIGLVTGGMLAGALLLGTAGLVAAQDPTGMTGGQMGAGMMGGGQMGAGMMGGGQMGTMTADQLEQMDALHDQMIESGVCDPAQMQAFHAQLNANR
jgi:Spy/CpxP family protein refolding chaperone